MDVVHRLNFDGRHSNLWSGQSAGCPDQYASSKINDVANDSASRGQRAGAATIEHDVATCIAHNLNRVVYALNFRNRIVIRNHGGVHTRLHLTVSIFRDSKELQLVTELLAEVDVDRPDGGDPFGID